MAKSQVILTAFVSVSIMFLVHLPEGNATQRRYTRIPLSQGATGPESIAFDCRGRGPYVGVSDGRILRWRGFKLGWKEIGHTSPNWDRTCLNSTNKNISTFENKCGRPLGLRFHPHSCQLYVVDAYYGLVVLNHSGQPAQVATNAGGVPFRLTNGLDIDPHTGFVYFSDTSARFQHWEFSKILETGDSTGRLLKYDPKTRGVVTLQSNLHAANGVAASANGDFVLVAEEAINQVSRYWLRGPRLGSFEPFIRLKASPDNISRNRRGDFWIAQRDPMFAKKVNKVGRITESVDPMTTDITHVEEFAGRLWIGSISNDYVIIITNR